MPSFDKELLAGRLESISRRSRTIFALTCSERLLPFYEAYCDRSKRGRWSYLRSASEELWNQVLEGTVRADHAFLAEYASLAPGDEIPRSERTLLDPLAENAVLALGSAWECQTSGESQKAFWAAEQAYEAMDYLAQNVEGIEYGAPGGEEALSESDLVQNEIRRQLDTLSTLEKISDADPRYVEVVRIQREDAKAVGQMLKSTVEGL